MAVKTKAETVNSTPRAGSTLCSFFWLTYFLGTIGFLGSIMGYGFCIPCYLTGRLAKKLGLTNVAKAFTAAGDFVLCRGMQYCLLSIQPWMNADIKIDLADVSKVIAERGNEKSGALIVSNHRSHLDAFILLSRIPGVRILAKSTLFFVPGLGPMMWGSQQIPVERKIDAFFKAMNIVRGRLANGNFVHIFPEMTRCEPGHKGTRQFSSLPFLIAIQQKVPILPVVFIGTDDVWPKSRFGLKFRQPMRAFSLPVVHPEEFASAEALRTEVRKRINLALEQNTTNESREVTA